MVKLRSCIKELTEAHALVPVSSSQIPVEVLIPRDAECDLSKHDQRFVYYSTNELELADVLLGGEIWT